MKTNKEKIIVAMSGGVDSSVAAALLVEQGYDVAAAFMVNYDEGDGQCWRHDYRDALRVAAKLGIKLHRLNFEKEYKRDVLDYMYKQYRSGNTPNPDILCNKFVKFGAWLEQMKRMGYTQMATGHYADIRISQDIKGKKVYSLMISRDKEKDQTYFLHQLNQHQLSKVMFPLGKYNKGQVRKLARKFDLPTAYKKESMGICFIGEVNMSDFLKKKIKTKKGKFVLVESNEVIGEHEGLPFYTIGQRHLGVFEGTENKRSLYVVGKNKDKNIIYLGGKDDERLFSDIIKLKNVNWIRQKAENKLKCLLRIRHGQKMQTGLILIKNGKISIQFKQPQRAVAPGQFAVIYVKGECLGGGEIYD